MLHGDLKSWSVYLEARRGGQVLVRVLDHCLVRPQAVTISAGGSSDECSIIRTPDYMAPEQWLDYYCVTEASDVYAWAVVVAELLAGARGLQWRGCPSQERHSFVRKKWVTQRCPAGDRPILAAGTPEAIRLLLAAAWAHGVKERATIVVRERAPPCGDNKSCSGLNHIF